MQPVIVFGHTYSMNFETLKALPLLDDDLDLSFPTIKYEFPLVITDVVVISSSIAGKPWLLAHSYYGDSSYMDLLMFFNGIDNPFSLPEGRIIVIPTLDSMLANINKAPIEDVAEVKPQVPTKDSRRLSFLNKRLPNRIEPTPVNVNLPTSQNIKARGGKIVFGDDVTVPDCVDGDTVTATQVLSKQVRSRILKRLQDNQDAG